MLHLVKYVVVVIMRYQTKPTLAFMRGGLLESLSAITSADEGLELLLASPKVKIDNKELKAYAILAALTLADNRNGSYEKIRDLGYEVIVDHPAGIALTDDSKAIVAVAPMGQFTDSDAKKSALSLVAIAKESLLPVTLTGFGKAALTARAIATQCQLDAVLFQSTPALPQFLFALINTLEAGGTPEQEPGVEIMLMKAGVAR